MAEKTRFPKFSHLPAARATAVAAVLTLLAAIVLPEVARADAALQPSAAAAARPAGPQQPFSGQR